MAACCPVIELRRYRLHSGTREKLIDLFDREFVETQEAVGMRVIGQFRDLDEPNHFVWLRGYRDMASRAQALDAFYTGEVWAKHRTEANGTMINSDNVLLLRPAKPNEGFAPPTAPRPEPGAIGSGRGLIVSTICHLAPNADADFGDFFERALRPLLVRAAATVLSAFVTEKSPNTFPKLPVREGETVFVWFSAFRDRQAYELHLTKLDEMEAWRREALPEMDKRIWRRNDVARLLPTARSQLQG